MKNNIARFIALFLIISPLLATSSHAAEKKAAKKDAKDAVVLMPMRATKDIPQDEMTQYEAALVKSLSEKYVVYSGQRVMEKVNDVYKKRSSEAKAGKECDETKCLQDIAIAFQTELVAVANIRKSGGGYSISLAINDVAEDKSVFSESLPCKGCDEFEVIRQLKTLTNGGPAAAEAMAPPQKQEGGSASRAQTSLRSNIPANFYVDDKLVGSGKLLGVNMDPSKAHKLSAKVEKYKEKIEYVQANERREIVGFVFLSDDKIAAPTVTVNTERPVGASEILLQCNQNAAFYVDGVKVGVGKQVRAQVNPNTPHTIVAKPDGYHSKEEYVEPPYNANFPIDFIYMMGDKEKS